MVGSNMWCSQTNISNHIDVNIFAVKQASHFHRIPHNRNNACTCIRNILNIALLVFLPFFKLKLFTKKIFFLLFAIESIEFGLMSIFAQLLLKFLEGHVVALLMLTTPIYMFLIEGFFLKKSQYLLFFITFIIVFASIIGWVIYEAFLNPMR